MSRNQAIGYIILFIGTMSILFIFTYLLRIVFSRMLTRRYFRYLLYIFAPGVIIHELSHIFCCLIAGARIYRFSLFRPATDEDGNLVLGYVEHEVVGPVRSAIIGLAPLLLSGFSIYLIARALWGPVIPLGAVEGTTFLPVNYLRQIASFVASLDFGSWKTWLFLYLVIVIVTNSGPSGLDIRNSLLGLSLISLGLISILGILSFRVSLWTNRSFSSVVVFIVHLLNRFTFVAALSIPVAIFALLLFWPFSRE